MSIPVAFQYSMREDIVKLVNLLRDKGYKNVKLLCHDHRDIPFAASFGDLDYVYTEDVYTYLSYLKNTRLNVTYRLHSFIPCLSLDIPTINISYDQRSISMLDTLNISDWNINMFKDDVTLEVQNRIDNIKDLDVIKENLKKTTWIGLRKTMIDAVNKFAQMVHNN
jgi:polysaccharide pyruvyl transferase WcaK-like protein